MIYLVALPRLNSRNDTATNISVIDATKNNPFTPSGPITGNLSVTTDKFLTAFQVKQQLNQSNQPAINTSRYISESSKLQSIEIKGLNDKLVYDIFISMDNYFLTFPQLIADSAVVRVTAKTLKKRS